MSFYNNKRKRNKPNVYINVAPLVDVMLVLMVIFMMTSQMVTVGIQVDLPKTKTEAKPNDEKEQPIVVSINKDKEIYIEEAKVSLDDLLKKLPSIMSMSKNETIYIKGDKSLSYGEIIEIMGIISESGICKVELIAEASGGGAVNDMRKKKK